MSRTRLNVYLEPSHAKRLAAVAAAKDVSKSTIVGGALASALLVDADQHQLGRRLDRLAKHLEKLEQDQTIAIETLALFIRYFLSVTPAIPQEQNQAAWAQGRLRFTQFVQQLGRNLQRGNSLVRDLQDELYPAKSDRSEPSAHETSTTSTEDA